MRVTLTVAACVLLFCLAVLAGASIARAEEDDPALTPEPPRYQQTGRGSRWEVQRWVPLLEEYPWPVDVALKVIDCESEGDPGAVNPHSGAKSLFQLLGWEGLAQRLFGTRDVKIPWVNVAMAHVLWQDSGGTFRYHWYASIRCWG